MSETLNVVTLVKDLMESEGGWQGSGSLWVSKQGTLDVDRRGFCLFYISTLKWVKEKAGGFVDALVFQKQFNPTKRTELPDANHNQAS